MGPGLENSATEKELLAMELNHVDTLPSLELNTNN